MQVNGPSGFNPVRGRGPRNDPPPTAAELRKVQTAAARVDVSATAERLSEATDPLLVETDFIDEVRIETVRRAIERGAFPIDPRAIAQRMLAEEG